MNKRVKVILVVGARPNFMKAAPIYAALRKDKRFVPILVHTGQHYSAELSSAFFRDLHMPKPDVYLGVGSASHAEQTARTMLAFEKVLEREDPDLVMVVGDVNSTIACSLATAKYRCARSANMRTRPRKPDRPHGQDGRDRLILPLIAHVEAGLRSFDPLMPEEINRVLTDHASDLLFTTCEDANTNLVREGIPRARIHFVGNVMIDSLLAMKRAATGEKWVELKREPYALVTLHRPSNVDDKRVFAGIWRALKRISAMLPVVFPVHPRTARVIGRSRARHAYGIILTPPLGYLEFLDLMSHATMVLTDSGGIQEETTILGVPCLTLRHNTERPITITQGTNKLVGTDPKKILTEATRIIERAQTRRRRYGPDGQKGLVRPDRPKFWDGHAAQRIVKALVKEFFV